MRPGSHERAAEVGPHERLLLACSLSLECYRRVLKREPVGFRRLVQAAWDDAGGCLDAPEEMSGGSCLAYELVPTPEEFGGPEVDMPGGAEQLVVRRERGPA